MAKEFAKAFYKSAAWKECRKSYIAKVYGLCERCGESGKVVPGYILHHKIKLNPVNINNPEITLNHDLLRYLCHDCHNIEHGAHEKTTREGLVFSNTGDLIQS